MTGVNIMNRYYALVVVGSIVLAITGMVLPILNLFIGGVLGIYIGGYTYRHEIAARKRARLASWVIAVGLCLITVVLSGLWHFSLCILVSRVNMLYALQISLFCSLDDVATTIGTGFITCFMNIMVRTVNMLRYD